jgi:hypothetical protein
MDVDRTQFRNIKNAFWQYLAKGACNNNVRIKSFKLLNYVRLPGQLYRFATDAGLMQTQGNFSLVLNAAGWLLNSKEAVAIPAKFIGSQSFVIPDETALIIIIVFIFALPLLIIGLGVRVYIKRKRL